MIMNKSFLSVSKCWQLIILALIPFAMISCYAKAEPPSLSGQSPNPLFSQQTKFLPVDQAFELSAIRQDDGSLTLNWIIARDYYLYNHRFQFESLQPSDMVLTPIIPPGIAKQDDYFGDVEVYYNNVTVTIPDAGSIQRLRIGYQGCAEAGLCYPPQDRFVGIQGIATNITDSPPDTWENAASDAAPNVAPKTEEQEFLQLLTGASLLKIVGLFLLAGLALTFTPCVLPMVPIISSLVIGQHPKPTRARAFTLSLTYVLAMALTYALAGTVTGYFGAELNLQMKLQSPTVLISIALLFVVFSLAMFDVYEIRLPSSIQTRLHQVSAQQKGGTYFGVAVIGVLSSLIVSPCVSAPLAGALVYISSTADPVLGGLALLSLGLGMGIPLLIIGTFGAQLLPKTGNWMNQIKVFFGVLLLAVALWMIERILPAVIVLALMIMLMLGYAVYLLKPFFLQMRLFRSMRFIIALTLFSYSSLLILGGINGQYNPMTPLDNLSAEKQLASHAIMERFEAVTSIEQLEQQLQKASRLNQTVMLDIYADWCVSCKILENEVFPDKKVSEHLANFLLLRADITKNSVEQQRFLKHFDLFGPPGLLFFDSKANELRTFRIQGEVNAKQLSTHLEAIKNAL